jgi:uncharacterized protein (TIRG00374 family)
MSKFLNSFSSYKSHHKGPYIYRRILVYFILAGIFFLLSFLTIYFVHRYVSGVRLRFDLRLLSFKVTGSLIILLGLYYLTDALRLYIIIKAMGFHVGFPYLLKLVFVNIFVSNVTPLATGGGIVQVFFLTKKGMPIGEATAATSIRTILAAITLFILTPIIIFFEPNLFRLFYQKNLIYYIAGFSCLYLMIFFTVLLRTKAIRLQLFRVFYFITKLGLLSRHRFRILFLKFSRELSLFSDGFKRFLRGRPGYVIMSVLSTFLFLLFLFSFSIILIRALGYEISLFTIMAFQVVLTFFMYFAPTPGAAGIAEGGYGLLFSQLVKKQDITLLTITWRFLTIYVGVFIGILIVYREIFVQRKVNKK